MDVQESSKLGPFEQVRVDLDLGEDVGLVNADPWCPPWPRYHRSRAAHGGLDHRNRPEVRELSIV